MKKGELRKAIVIFDDKRAGVLEEIPAGYRFTYDDEFAMKNRPISVALPTQQKIYESDTLFPFFVGLLPEGWYLNIVTKKLKIDENNAFGILLATCGETTGAVSIMESK